jgi:hypothetical protein
MLSQLGWPVAYRAARGGESYGRFTGRTQERDPASGWAGEEVSAHGREEKLKGCLFFKSSLNSKPI